jgi:serine/threonine-protein kinase
MSTDSNPRMKAQSRPLPDTSRGMEIRPSQPLAAPEPFERRWAPGCFVGPYQILRRLGQGSFGVSVLARRAGPARSHFEKLVALKIMRSELALDREFSLRVRDEAKLQAALRHDQLVDVYDVRWLDGDFVIEMEFVDGLTLYEYLARSQTHGVPFSTVGFIMTRLLRGVAWMHEAVDSHGHALHLIHRDIKPGNVFLSRGGAIKLGDFGLVRGRGRLFETDVSEEVRVLGTPRYMAPEQCELTPMDGRADVYALGIMLYEMLSGGKHPAGHHDAKNDYEALRGTLAERRIPIRTFRADLSPRLAALVDAMVARHAPQRPMAADALRALPEVLPFESAREELALQGAVTRIARQREHHGAYTPSAADDPTECMENPLAAGTTEPLPRPMSPKSPERDGSSVRLDASTRTAPHVRAQPEGSQASPLQRTATRARARPEGSRAKPLQRALASVRRWLWLTHWLLAGACLPWNVGA